MKRKGTIILASVALIGAVGWYWGSPAYAMSQLRDAAIEGNAEDLEERIDFASVRSSLKEQMRAQLAAEMVSTSESNGFAAFASMLAMGMVDSMIDGLVTPKSMSAMIKRGQMKQGPSGAAESEAAPVEWSIERDGFSRFEATPHAGDGKPVPTMVFERDGIGWRLVDVEIPEGGLGRGAGGA